MTVQPSALEPGTTLGVGGKVLVRGVERPRRCTRWRSWRVDRRGRGGTSARRRRPPTTGPRGEADHGRGSPGESTTRRLTRPWDRPGRPAPELYDTAAAGEPRQAPDEVGATRPCARMSASMAANASRRFSRQPRSRAVRRGVVTRTPATVRPVRRGGRVRPRGHGVVCGARWPRSVNVSSGGATSSSRYRKQSTPQIQAAVRSQTTACGLVTRARAPCGLMVSRCRLARIRVRT